MGRMGMKGEGRDASRARGSPGSRLLPMDLQLLVLEVSKMPLTACCPDRGMWDSRAEGSAQGRSSLSRRRERSSKRRRGSTWVLRGMFEFQLTIHGRLRHPALARAHGRESDAVDVVF
eukprot:762970-Hanusia_phi.AAC.6